MFTTTVYPAAQLYLTAWYALREARAAAESETSSGECMTRPSQLDGVLEGGFTGQRRHSLVAMLFAAHTAEGYVNQALACVFGQKTWGALDKGLRISWEDKVTLLADKCGGDVDWKGRDPYQTVRRLTSFRNKWVHPKPEELGGMDEQDPLGLAPTTMEGRCTLEQAEAAVKQVEEMCAEIHGMVSGTPVGAQFQELTVTRVTYPDC